jgi:hypothetical protein
MRGLKTSIRHLRAHAVPYLALFAALGGTSFAAARVTGRNVTDGSLTGADIRDGSLSSRDVSPTAESARVRRGPRGPRGRRGPQGPGGLQGLRGPVGLVGPVGPPGLAAVRSMEVVSAVSPSDSSPTHTAVAMCPAGKRVVSGGADIDGDAAGSIRVYLNGSTPVQSPADAGWTATGVEDSAGFDGNWHITVYAECAIVT